MPIPQFPRPAHVLVVDDDATNRVVASKLCVLFGGTAESTDCGEQAVVLCATAAFDVVLMDVRMPRTDGMEAAVAIRALPGPAGRTPIVAVTGDVCARVREECLEAGMNAFVEKPIGAQKLFDAMSRALLSEEARVAAKRKASAQG